MTTLSHISKILLTTALTGALLGACHKTPTDTSGNNAATPTPIPAPAPETPAPPAGTTPDGTGAATTPPTSPDAGGTAPAPAPKY